jgi:hypothetical protein
MTEARASRNATIVRNVVIVLAGALTLWIATGVTLNFTLAGRAPDLVRSWWPAGVTPKVAIGRSLLTDERLSPATQSATRAMLRDAVLREPVNTYALGALAAITDYMNDKKAARTLFRLSESVSRRNIVTELWLIEDAVERESVGEAIAHYDRAMRVSIDTRATLLPVMLSAASDPAVLKEIMPVLAQRPLWWKDYMQRLAASGENTTVMAASIRAVRPDLGDPEEAILTENILRRMIALKDERRAIRVANDLEGTPGDTRSLRGGNFDVPDGVLPFAWWLRDEGNVRTYRDTVPNGSQGLWIVTSDDTTGGVAQQLIGLSPGRYTLSGAAGDVPSDPMARPAIEVSCGNGMKLTRFVLPASGEQGRGFRFSFTVPPAGCATQWIGITSASAADTSVWIDNLAIAQ